MANLMYAPIEKVEAQDDGTIKVFGYASSAATDSDGEIVLPEAIKDALPDYMKFGAVREMHQPKAAGTAIEAKVLDDGRTWFGAHVVDEAAIKKVQANVYKGFSIGGKILKRDENETNKITGIKLVEISLVDRPANPDAVFTMYKAEDVKPKQPQEELDAIQKLSKLVDTGLISPTELVKYATEQVELKKASFWDIRELAGILADLRWLQQVVQYDQDNNFAGRIGQHIEALANVLVEMVSAEIEGVDTMSADEIKAAAEKLDETGKDDVTKAATEEPAATEAPVAEPVEKAATTDDILTKFGNLLDDKLKPIVDRIENLESQPAAPKGVLKAVGKEQDVGKAANAEEDRPPAGATPEQLAIYEIKKIHQAGGLI